MSVGAVLPDRLDLASAGTDSADELARLRAENAHLRRENIRLTSESELLRAAARIVVEELDTRILIQEIGRLATSVLNADCVVIGLSDEDVFQEEACYTHGGWRDEGRQLGARCRGKVGTRA